MRLTIEQQQILAAISQGNILKGHRYLDGTKVHQLHAVDGSVTATVASEDVQQLVQLGLLTSNMKFPAATYTITVKGAKQAANL